MRHRETKSVKSRRCHHCKGSAPAAPAGATSCVDAPRRACVNPCGCGDDGKPLSDGLGRQPSPPSTRSRREIPATRSRLLRTRTPTVPRRGPFRATLRTQEEVPRRPARHSLTASRVKGCACTRDKRTLSDVPTVTPERRESQVTARTEYMTRDVLVVCRGRLTLPAGRPLRRYAVWRRRCCSQRPGWSRPSSPFRANGFWLFESPARFLRISCSPVKRVGAGGLEPPTPSL